MTSLGGLGGVGSGEILLTAAFVAYETSFNFSQYLPSIMTIGTFVDSADKVKMIRQGEVVAAVYGLAFAILFSLITASWIMFVFAALAIGATLAVYEWALRQAPGWGAH